MNLSQAEQAIKVVEVELNRIKAAFMKSFPGVLEKVAAEKLAEKDAP